MGLGAPDGARGGAEPYEFLPKLENCTLTMEKGVFSVSHPDCRWTRSATVVVAISRSIGQNRRSNLRPLFPYVCSCPFPSVVYSVSVCFPACLSLTASISRRRGAQQEAEGGSAEPSCVGGRCAGWEGGAEERVESRAGRREHCVRAAAKLLRILRRPATDYEGGPPATAGEVAGFGSNVLSLMSTP